MRKRKLASAAMLLCIGWGATSAMAATNAELLNSIDLGLTNLLSQQRADGSWYYGGYDDAGTAAAVYAMITQRANWGANAAAYQAAVDKGMAYLGGTATATAVGAGQTINRVDGNSPCPGGGATCTGVYWYGAGESTYTTGLVAQAVGAYAAMPGSAAPGGALAGMSWGQVAQGISNTFSAGQSSNIGSNTYGGWRYFPGTQDSDSSTTQWAVTSLIYDQALGATTPAIVKTSLPVWYSRVQAGDGSVCYQPGAGPCDHADTGGLLLGMKYLGRGTGDPQVQAALNFLNTNWKQGPSGTWYGNFGHPYAMWAVYKGLETTIGLNDTTAITNLLTDCGAVRGSAPSGACNWYQDYEEWLVTHQNGDGSWSGTDYWTGELATAFDLAILSATEIPIPTPEPASLAVLAAGLFGLAGLRRRFRG